MPPFHPQRNPSKSKKEACYSCVVTSTILLSVVLLGGLLYAGVILGMSFRAGRASSVREFDSPMAPTRATPRAREHVEAAIAPSVSQAVPVPSCSTGPLSLRPVIVGMAMNIDIPNLYRFVRSAHDHVPTADIVLFVDDDSGERGEIMKLFGVEVSSRNVPVHFDPAGSPPSAPRSTVFQRSPSPRPFGRGTPVHTDGS